MKTFLGVHMCNVSKELWTLFMVIDTKKAILYSVKNAHLSMRVMEKVREYSASENSLVTKAPTNIRSSLKNCYESLERYEKLKWNKK